MSDQSLLPDGELLPRSRRFMQIGWLTLLVLSISAANNAASDLLVTSLILGAFCLVAIAMWQGREMALDGAIAMVVLTLASLVAASMWLTNGLHDVAAHALPAILFISVLLLEGRFVWMLLGGILAFAVALYASELTGWSAVRPTGPASVRTLIDFSMILAATAYIAWLLVGDLRQAVATARSQTQRAIQATGRIRETEQSLQLAQLIFETTDEAIFVCDPDGRLVEVNPAACRLAGYSRAEMLTLRHPDLVAGSDRTRVAAELGLCSVDQVIKSRWLLLCRDGSTLPLDVMVQRLPDDRYLAIGRNLSDRERADQQLAQARVALQDAEHTKLEFLAKTSRDVLTAVDAMHEQVNVLGQTALTPEQRDCIGRLDRSIREIDEAVSAHCEEPLGGDGGYSRVS